MAPKALLQNKILFFFIATFLVGCANQKKENNQFTKADVSEIPDIAIFVNNDKLKWENGICFFDGIPFSGFIKEKYESDTLKSIGSYYNGKRHGMTKTFYPDGKCRDERSYKDNLSYGRHRGFWENGNPKFDFTYYNDKLEGIQKQWYENGKLYTMQTYTNDSESGMQKAWRRNGKLFANYEVKDGICYGLQKTNLCYTLRNEKIK
jgi:antitoxin component YwqK of YwqJK toxin-antitoxin module